MDASRLRLGAGGSVAAMRPQASQPGARRFSAVPIRLTLGRQTPARPSRLPASLNLDVRGERNLTTSSEPPQGASSDRSQIKSRARVRDLAEVYTHEREVQAMLDLVADMFPCEDEPRQHRQHLPRARLRPWQLPRRDPCRKLRYVTPSRYGRGERFEHRVLRCLASIYGIDISADNITEARERMRALVASTSQHTARPRHARVPRRARRDPCDERDPRGHPRRRRRDRARRLRARRQRHLHPRVGAPTRPSRERAQPLHARASRRDEVPVHYSELARQTEPTVADSARREAA